MAVVAIVAGLGWIVGWFTMHRVARDWPFLAASGAAWASALAATAAVGLILWRASRRDIVYAGLMGVWALMMWGGVGLMTALAEWYLQ